MNDFVKLAAVRHVCFDMDGTLYEGGTLYPSTLPFLNFLREHGLTWTYLSNNSSYSVAEYLNKLAQMGIPARKEEFLNSTLFAVHELKRRGISRIWVMGMNSICAEFEEHGFRLDPDAPEAVIVTFDRELTYEKLCRTAWLLKKGIPGIATHPDVFCPTDLPTFLPDCGAMTACLETATGKKLEVWGKPHPGILHLAAKLNGVMPSSVLMCGDRAGTDILCGKLAGTLTAQIMSAFAEDSDGVEPDFRVRDLGELQREWQLNTAL